MHNAQRYPFVARKRVLGEASLQPVLPMTLVYRERSVAVAALLDTGAMINVLPYQLGLEFGAIWKEQPTPLKGREVYSQYPD